MKIWEKADLVDVDFVYIRVYTQFCEAKYA